MLSASVLKRVILYSLAIHNSPDSSHANYVKWEDACSINGWEVETTTISNSKHNKKLKDNNNNITVTVSQETLYMQHT